MDNSILKCDNVSKQFTQGGEVHDILQNVSLNLSLGQRMAVMGASGSGKSTLLHILSGLEKPSSGCVWVDDACLSDMTMDQSATLRRNYLGFIYQSHHLLPEFSVLENVSMPLWIRGEVGKPVRVMAQTVLEQVGLLDYTQYSIHQLSGGQRQRVAIARALVGKPKIILADEPTGNLDQETSHDIANLLISLNEQRQCAMIVVTHDITLAGMIGNIQSLVLGKLEHNN